MPSVIDFLIPFKSSQVSVDWSNDSTLLRRTLESIQGQSKDAFRIFLVCHDLPDFTINDSRIHVVHADWLPPRREGYVSEGMNDKWRKLHLGLVAASADPSSYIMFVDADDLVSRRIVEFCSHDRHPYGYMLKTGYVHRKGGRFMRYTSGFNCGTNAIVNTSTIAMPYTMDITASNNCLILANGHTRIEHAMRESGHPLGILPFPGAVYTVHNDNHSKSVDGESRLLFFKQTLGNIWSYRYLNDRLRNEFSIRVI